MPGILIHIFSERPIHMARNPQESIRGVFEEQLDGWYRAPGVWPAKRDLTTFQTWFEVTFHSMIVDFSDDVLEHEKL